MTTGLKTSGGEGGIRTLGTGFSPYNGLANRRIRPLCHLSGGMGTVYHLLLRKNCWAWKHLEKGAAKSETGSAKRRN